MPVIHIEYTLKILMEYIYGKLKYDMVGEVEIFGEEYKLYDQDNTPVAALSFNTSNTEGKMYDSNGILVAEYKSNYL